MSSSVGLGQAKQVSASENSKNSQIEDSHYHISKNA